MTNIFPIRSLAEVADASDANSLTQNLKFLARIKLITAILSFYFLNSYGIEKAIIKANILRGESFVTANTNPKDIENIVSELLTKKGFEIVDTVTPGEDILFVDLFVYQFYAQYPAITLTIRTKNGVQTLSTTKGLIIYT